MARSLLLPFSVGAHALVAATLLYGGDGIISDIEISRLRQADLAMSFRVDWETGVPNEATDSDTVDIWLLARQSQPSSWIQTLVKEGVNNTSSEWVETGDEWASREGWNKNETGEALVCVYETSAYTNNACSEALPIESAAEAPLVTDDGISNVQMPRLDRNGLSISLSVTWADGGGSGGSEDIAKLVDIWFTAMQDNPRSWVQFAIVEGAQNDGSEYMDVGDAWAADAAWDETRDGKIWVCVYNTFDYSDTACTDLQDFAAVATGTDSDAGAITDTNQDLDASDSSDGGGGSNGGVTATFVLLAIGFGAVTTWMAITARRRQQRRRWLREVQEAEALPEDSDFDPSSPIPAPNLENPYSRF